MKNFLLTALIAAGISLPGWGAEVFPESFETGLDATGWKVTTSGAANCDWSVVTYASETSQFPKLIPIPENVGASVLRATTKGSFSAKIAPDNLIESPLFSVGEGEWLSFMLSYNMAANIAANTPEAGRSRLAVYVSPTGAEGMENYTDMVYSETPMGLNDWKVVSADLSQYAGKSIRVAFRVYAEEPVKNMVLNQLYIDNVNIGKSAAKDINLMEIGGLTAGTVRTQYPTVKIKNWGTDVTSFKLNVSVNEADPVVEDVVLSIPYGEEVEYTLKTPCEFSLDGVNTVTVTAVLDGDQYTGNNTASASTVMFGLAELPFTLSDGEEAAYQMISTAEGSVRVPDGWQFMTNYNSWVHTNYSKVAHLFTADAYSLDGTPLKVNFSGVLTGSQATFAVYLTKDVSDFGDPVATRTVSKGDASGFVLVPVEEPGDYLIGFRFIGGGYQEQVELTSLSIDKAAILPDVAVSDASLITSVPAGVDFPVTISVTNEGSEEATEVKVAYKCGDITVTEEIPSVGAGKTVAHTFTTPLNLENGEYEIEFSAACQGDVNNENDKVKTSRTVYTPMSVPFRDSFEEEYEAGLWNSFSTNGNNTLWRAIGGYEFDGTHILSLAATTMTHSVWAFSPAINIEAGWKGRLSYYYGSGGNQGTATVKAYLTKSTDPETVLEEGIPVSFNEAGGVTVAYASGNVEIEDGGLYYIAFLASDGAQSMLIDDVRLDSTQEIALLDASVSVCEAAYELEDGKVSVRMRNYGSEDFSNVRLAYAVYVTKDGESKAAGITEENYEGSIAAGQEVTYEFKTPVKFDKEGMYTIVAGVQASGDTDTKNNTFSAVGPEILPTMQLPAKWDMEYSDNLHGFVFDKFNTWKLGAVKPYAGSKSVSHTGGILNDNGDRMTFNRVYLPAGKYEFGFFWITTTNQTSVNHLVSFNFKLGTTAEGDASDKVLFQANNVTAPAKCHVKELKEFTVEKDGYYYLSLTCTGGGILSSLTIDDVCIYSPEADIDLLNEGDVYTADFSAEDDGWYRYNPIKLQSQQWDKLTSGGSTYLELVEFEANGESYKGSWLQAPSMNLKKGIEYEVNLDMNVLQVYDSNIALTGTEYIALHTSARDVPSEFEEIGKFTSRSGMLTFTPDRDGLHYLTLLAKSSGNAVFRINGFNIKALDGNGVEEVETGRFTIVGNRLCLPDGVAGEVYTLSGCKVFSGTGEITLPSGIYVVVADGEASRIMIR